MIPRAEHPKPQWERTDWTCLNGEWEFEQDRAGSGLARGLYRPDAAFHGKITVPFCPQSRLSGIADLDFMRAVWYRRRVTVPADRLSGRILLHFGAVDYTAIIFCNGKKCGEHRGGYVSFSVDLTGCVRAGENVITVSAEDDERNRLIPHGKQSSTYDSRGCDYSRTTGIWQTVWLEYVPEVHVENARYLPSAETGTLTVIADLCGAAELTVRTSFDGEPTGDASVYSDGGQVTLTVPLTKTHLWEVGKGGLYDLTLSYGTDTVKSYFGLRSIAYRDRKFFLNGKSVFQRLVLDQGFYPDGIYTAPSDEALAADIDRAVAMGFNGARLHQKVFEERFLFHADKKGYLVFAEYPNWGLDHTYADAVYGILPEWLEEVRRDANHPSIVGWCPFNETWDIAGRKQYDPLLSLVYHATKAADPTRPCIDTSGNYHVVTDLYDVHDYEQDPAAFAAHYASLSADGSHSDQCGQRQHYDGKSPFFVSEYGGIRWSADDTGWGYGTAPKTEEEFLERLRGLTDVLLDNPVMFGFCYTQLTDIEQEQNGLYTYERIPKFPPQRIAAIIGRKAAVED